VNTVHLQNFEINKVCIFSRTTRRRADDIVVEEFMRLAVWLQKQSPVHTATRFVHLVNITRHILRVAIWIPAAFTTQCSDHRDVPPVDFSHHYKNKIWCNVYGKRSSSVDMSWINHKAFAFISCFIKSNSPRDHGSETNSNVFASVCVNTYHVYWRLLKKIVPLLCYHFLFCVHSEQKQQK
jgi:hypothetical protein